MATYNDHRFLMTHLVYCNGSGSWATSFIQFPSVWYVHLQSMEFCRRVSYNEFLPLIRGFVTTAVFAVGVHYACRFLHSGRLTSSWGVGI